MRIDRKSNSWLGTERLFCGCFQSKGFFVTFWLMVGESHFPLLKGCWNFLGGWSGRQTDTQMEREEEDGYATKFPL